MLPELYDRGRLMRELHVSRAFAEAVMRRCPKQHVPGLRKVFVRADDVRALLDENLVDVKIEKPLRSVA